MAIKYYFYQDIRLKVQFGMSLIAWLTSLFFGILTPIFTNFMSIRKALTHNLKDSLDLYHRSVNAMTIVFVKLARLGISRL